MSEFGGDNKIKGINRVGGKGKREFSLLKRLFLVEVHLRHLREDHVVHLWKGHLRIDIRKSPFFLFRQ